MDEVSSLYLLANFLILPRYLLPAHTAAIILSRENSRQPLEERERRRREVDRRESKKKNFTNQSKVETSMEV